MSEPSYDLVHCYDDYVIPDYYILTQYSGISYSCWYIRSGEVKVETADSKIHATAGDWVFIEPLTMKSHIFRGCPQIISIRFSVTWNDQHVFLPLSAPWKYQGDYSEKLTETATELCQFMRKLGKRKIELQPSEFAKRNELFSAWAYYWHSLREKRSGATLLKIDSRAQAIAVELMKSRDAKPVDYALLGKKVNLSKAQINRVFKDSTGQSPKSWKESACLKAAEDMLDQNDFSVKEIAASLRFSDASHFTKWFKNKTGQTPSEWQKVNRQFSYTEV